MKVIEKPWGKEEVVEINDKYMAAGKMQSTISQQKKKQCYGKLRSTRSSETDLCQNLYLHFIT